MYDGMLMGTEAPAASEETGTLTEERVDQPEPIFICMFKPVVIAPPLFVAVAEKVALWPGTPVAGGAVMAPTVRSGRVGAWATD